MHVQDIGKQHGIMCRLQVLTHDLHQAKIRQRYLPRSPQTVAGLAMVFSSHPGRTRRLADDGSLRCHGLHGRVCVSSRGLGLGVVVRLVEGAHGGACLRSRIQWPRRNRGAHSCLSELAEHHPHRGRSLARKQSRAAANQQAGCGTIHGRAHRLPQPPGHRPHARGSRPRRHRGACREAHVRAHKESVAHVVGTDMSSEVPRVC